MADYSWSRETSDWVSRRRGATPELADALVRFFEQAFEHTSEPAQAWFGVHASRASLRVGNIWLASAVASGAQEKGAWLLVEQTPEVEGWAYRPAKSTQRYQPLNWAHTPKLESAAIAAAVASEALWHAYASASRKVLGAPVSQMLGTEKHEAVDKRRLADFWPER